VSSCSRHSVKESAADGLILSSHFFKLLELFFGIFIAVAIDGIAEASMGFLSVLFWQVALDVAIFVEGASLDT